MKKIALVVLLSASLFSCRKSVEGEFLIEGKVDNLPNGKYVVLQKQDDSLGIVAVDTVKLKDGKFTFKGKANEPKMHIIQVLGEKASGFIIVESGDISITIDKDSISKNKYGGTYNNDELQKFTDQTNAIGKKIKAFEVNNQSKLISAQQNNDTVTINKLRKEYVAISNESKDYVTKYMENNTNSYLSLLLIKSLFNQFDADVVKIQKYYDNLTPELKNTSEGKSILKLLKKFKSVSVGRKALDFTAPDLNGKPTSLLKSLGKVTIIDFWASWCGPCRIENPNVVKLYNEFHTQGLNIVGVSLDDNKEQWKQAVEKDQLNWIQVSNLKKWKDPIAIQYGVEAIPKTILVNKFGYVVAIDLKGEQLRNKIVELLKS